MGRFVGCFSDLRKRRIGCANSRGGFLGGDLRSLSGSGHETCCGISNLALESTRNLDCPSYAWGFYTPSYRRLDRTVTWKRLAKLFSFWLEGMC